MSLSVSLSSNNNDNGNTTTTDNSNSYSNNRCRSGHELRQWKVILSIGRAHAQNYPWIITTMIISLDDENTDVISIYIYIYDKIEIHINHSLLFWEQFYGRDIVFVAKVLIRLDYLV